MLVKFLKKNWEKIFFCFILLVALVTRFWKIRDLFYFGIDEEYQSLLAESIIKNFHVIWIGLSAANTGFYVGPGLVYVHAFLLWISGLNPAILAYAASLCGLLTVLLLFIVARSLFGPKAAIVSSAIYSFSTFAIIYDRRFWNSTFVPLVVILLFLSLVKSRVNPRWYVLTAVLIGLSFHIHLSLFIFIPITLFVVTKELIIEKRKIPFSVILASLFLFFLIISPLVVFDFVHNFDNLKAPIRMLAGMGKGKSYFSTNVSLFVSMLPSLILDVRSYLINLILLLFVVIAFCVFLLKKKNHAEKILNTIIVFYILSFIFYPGKMLDYYYIGFLPFVSLLIALILKKQNAILLFFCLIAIAIINLSAFIRLPLNRGLTTKRNLIKNTLNYIGKEGFYLDTNRDYLFFGGWRYLFTAYGKRPNQSQADQMFGWIYPREISEDKSAIKIIITEAQKGTKITEKPSRKICEGVYCSYIFKN